MTGIHFSHVPFCSAVGNEEILCERRKCLVVIRMDVHSTIVVVFLAIVNRARGRVERGDGLTVDLVRCF